MEAFRSKAEHDRIREIETLKKQHLSQIEAMDYENTKLKEVINSKNSEIEQIIIKNNKVKDNYEDSLALHHRDNEDLKSKII
jgi:hypothetical protein